MRVAKLDLNHCPHGLKSMSFNNNEIQTCVVNNDEAGCTSLDFSTFDIHYTKVCGQIRAYQIGTPDGFHGDQRTNIQTANIADNYLDGISITSNQQHIWSFAAGRCNCSGRNKPNFITGDWGCDKILSCQTGMFCEPLLWLSQTCGETTSPWFFKNVVNSAASVEMKFCRDQEREDEDLAINILELYVQ